MTDPRSVPVRFSRLKEIAKSPAHYLHAITTERPDTPAMRRGRIVHAMLLGRGDSIVVYEGTRRGKAWESFRAEHQAADIVTETEMDDALPLIEAVDRHSEAKRLLTDGDCERKIAWDVAGRLCEGTPDCVGSDFITDLKSCRSSEPGRFSREAVWSHYHAQLSWYGYGCAARGEARPRRYIVAVEATPPYPVTVLELTGPAILAGEKCWRLWFERLMACEASNEWPAYAQSTLELDVPDEQDLSFEEAAQ